MQEQENTLRHDLIRIIRRAETVRPRSMQSEIGPSQVGNPCDRSLAFVLAGGRAMPGQSHDPLPAIVGSAVHAWLEDAAGVDNTIEEATQGAQRWVTERKLDISHPRFPISGSCDLFDLHTGTVIDWKVVGGAALRKAEHGGVSDTYRVQAHLYGLGYSQLGYEVNEVAICMVPRNGPLGKTLLFSEKWSSALASAALERAADLRGTPWDSHDASPGEDVCRWCPVPYKACAEGELYR